MAKFKYKDYKSSYTDELTELLRKREETASNYDFKSDPAYLAAAKELERRQNYASESARAKMNALVGGTGAGTATATAMAQVNNDYIKRINDLIPVYKQYALDDLDKRIDTLLDAQEKEYDRYLEEKNFAYKQYTDDREYNYKKAKDEKEFTYQKQKDKANLKLEKQKLAAEYLNSLKISKSKSSTSSTSKSSSSKTSTSKNSSEKNKIIENALVYAKYLWSGSDSSSVRKTFNYIRSLGLSNKETLSLVSKLQKKDGRTALNWYSLLGYGKS